MESKKKKKKKERSEKKKKKKKERKKERNSEWKKGKEEPHCFAKRSNRQSPPLSAQLSITRERYHVLSRDNHLPPLRSEPLKHHSNVPTALLRKLLIPRNGCTSTWFYAQTRTKEVCSYVCSDFRWSFMLIPSGNWMARTPLPYFGALRSSPSIYPCHMQSFEIPNPPTVNILRFSL